MVCRHKDQLDMDRFLLAHTPRIALLAFAVAAGGASASAEPICAVAVELVDAETGGPLPGLLRAETAAGTPVPLEGLLSRGHGMDPALPIGRWSVLAGRSTLRLPQERLVLEALHGLETKLSRVALDLTGQDRADIKIPLRRFYRASDKALRSGNTHLHLMKLSRPVADRYLREIPKADGLDVVFLSYLERAVEDRTYVSNAYTQDDLAALSASSGVLFGNGVEHRHNFEERGEGYGHVMLLDLRRRILPVSIGPGIMKAGTDGLPLRRGIDEARRDGATVVWCHNTFGLEDIANWATGRPHAQNIFDGDPSGNGSYADTFYRYLNAGLRVPFSTGTDWFMYDFSRAYVHVPTLRTPKDWLQGLAAGRSAITNGPLLEFQVDGRPLGDTVRLAQPGRVRVEGSGSGRIDFQRLELVRNGEVLRTAPSRPVEGYFTADLGLDLDVAEPCWLALRTPPPPVKRERHPQAPVPLNDLGQTLFAHTSPVYVEVAGRAVFMPSVAQDLLDEVRRNKELVEQRAVFADDHERGHVLAVYDEGIAAIEKLLKQ